MASAEVAEATWEDHAVIEDEDTGRGVVICKPDSRSIEVDDASKAEHCPHCAARLTALR